jgi:hypothetical protein
MEELENVYRIIIRTSERKCHVTSVPVMYEETEIYNEPVNIVTDVALLQLLSYQVPVALALPLEIKSILFLGCLLYDTINPSRRNTQCQCGLNSSGSK